VEAEALQVSEPVDHVETVAALALDRVAVERQSGELRQFGERVNIGELHTK